MLVSTILVAVTACGNSNASNNTTSTTPKTALSATTFGDPTQKRAVDANGVTDAEIHVDAVVTETNSPVGPYTPFEFNGHNSLFAFPAICRSAPRIPIRSRRCNSARRRSVSSAMAWRRSQRSPRPVRACTRHADLSPRARGTSAPGEGARSGGIRRPARRRTDARPRPRWRPRASPPVRALRHRTRRRRARRTSAS